MDYNSGKLLPAALFGSFLFLCYGVLSLFAYDFDCKLASYTNKGPNPYEPIKSILSMYTSKCNSRCGALFCYKTDHYNSYVDYSWSCFAYANQKECDLGLQRSYRGECTCRVGADGVNMSNANFFAHDEMRCQGKMITENGIAEAPFAPGNVATCSSSDQCVAVFCEAGELIFHLWTCSYSTEETCAKTDAPKSANDERAKLGLNTSKEWHCVCHFGEKAVNMSNALIKPPKELKCQNVIVTEDATVNKALKKTKKELKCAYGEKHCATVSCSAGLLKFNERMCTNATTENECAKVPAKINAQRKNLSLPTTEDWNCTCQFVTEKVPSGYNLRHVGNGFGMLLLVPIQLGILSLFHAAIFGSA